MSRFFSPKYKNLVPYTPGEQPKEMEYVKLNTNESPFPPSQKAVEYAAKMAQKLRLYPDPDMKQLVAKLAETYGVKESQVVVTNGSDETLNFAFMAYCDASTPAVFADLTYGFYPVFADLNGIPYETIPLKEDFTLDVADYCGVNKTIFIANPNAPTGIALSLAQIEQVLKTNPNNVVVVDEAYVDFGTQSAIGLVDQYENLLVIQTFSKSRSMAGARLGFAVGNESLIADLNTLRYSTNPYNVNMLTMAAGLGMLEDPEYMLNNCKKIQENREYTVNELKKLGFYTTDSMANFIFAKHDKVDGGELYRRLKEKGVLVRHFDKERICQFNRITIGSREQMEIFVKTVKEILEELL